MKTCTKCNLEKPIERFQVRNGKPISRCKDCIWAANKKWREENPERHAENNRRSQLRYNLRNVYNLSEEELEDALNKSKGICSICEKETELVIDHCHKREQFRGLICVHCNRGLGAFFDSPEIMQKAIEYLKVHAV